MGFLDDVLTAIEFTSMGEKEAASRIVQQEIGDIGGGEGSPDDQNNFYNSIDEHHYNKYGSAFFGGKDKNGIANKLFNFHGAQAGVVRAGNIMLNNRVMQAMDLWNMDENDINAAVKPYADAADRAGLALLNELATYTEASNGALAQSSGGKLTSEEAEFLMEAIGNWNPEARARLEMDNNRGKFFNQTMPGTDKKVIDFLDPSDWEAFGGGPVETNQLTPSQKSWMMANLSALGEESTAQALKAKWDGDEQIASQVNMDRLNGIYSCVDNMGGLRRDDKGAPIKISETSPKGFTHKKGTEAGEGSFGQSGETNLVTLTGSVSQKYDIDRHMAGICMARTEHPFGPTASPKYDAGIARELGLSTTDLINTQRASTAYDTIYNDEHGLLAKISRNYAAEYGDQDYITGIRVPQGIQERYGVGPTIAMSDESNYPILIAILKHHDMAGSSMEFVTGGIQDGERGRNTNFRLKKTPRQMLSNGDFLGKDSNYYEYGDQKIPLFRNYDDWLDAPLQVFRTELDMYTSDPYTARERISSKLKGMGDPRTDGYIRSLTGRILAGNQKVGGMGGY
tara:strand:+ start:9725 stop:11428 length:1704 start_codon:yes stop_codon:yes gene_type:complete